MTTELQKRQEILLSYCLKGDDVKRNFDANWLSIFDRTHHDLPDRYKIDFIHQAQLSGADPRKKQIHLTTYFSRKLGHTVGVSVFSYHFFLDRANQTGEMSGLEVSSEVEDVFNPIKGEMQKQLVSTARVTRKNRGETIYKARWSECYNAKNSIWNERPYQMLEKTAIANVLRWAFPEVMSGMYIEEEVTEEHDSVTHVINEAEGEQKVIEHEKKQEETEQKIAEAKNGAIKKKAPLIELITELSSSITKGFTVDKKVEWMMNTLEIDSFARLQAYTVAQLQELVSKLEDIKSKPIVMA